MSSQPESNSRPQPPMPGVLVRRLRLRHYKSIAACDIEFDPLTILVGWNGAGKSNVVDGIRFVADCLTMSLDHALRERGGIKEVRRRSHGHPTNLAVRLDLDVSSDVQARLAFVIAAKPKGDYAVKSEICRVLHRGAEPNDWPWYEVRAGAVRSSLVHPPKASVHGLYLSNLSGVPEFEPVHRAISEMGFYNLNPAAMRELQAADPWPTLRADGANAARILDQLHREAPDDADLVDRYLAEIVPGIASVRQKVIGPRETLEFTQAGTGSRRGTTFLAQSMSDGTLRSLGILLAILQQSSSRPSRSQDRLHRLVAIEEPETALHPAATSCVLEVMLEASSEAQIILTSHSPDLLDHDELPADAIRPVVMEDGATRIGVLAHGARSALRDHLYTAGELMRMRQLLPDRSSFDIDPNQLDFTDLS